MDSPADGAFADHSPDLPVAISLVGQRYLLFDVEVAAYLRREHRICGTTVGTLSLSPAQNLFLGIPVEIMPEEAQLLVEKGVARIVDDARAHEQATRSPDAARRADYLARLQKQSKQFEQHKVQEKEQARQRILNGRSKPAADASVDVSVDTSVSASHQNESASDLFDFGEGGTPTNGVPDSQHSDTAVKVLPPAVTSVSSSYQITPTTSAPLLPNPTHALEPTIHDLPSSYPLYKHLNEQGFFMTPGLRFGCQYTVYPGDPLRFHSHFLAVGARWDEEVDLMDIVGGGRLGTGVKKGFLLGGASPLGDVRTFSVEWAVM